MSGMTLDGSAPEKVKVLFLDFDGVVHPGRDPQSIGPNTLFLEVGHFGWLDNLVQLLRSRREIGVVVHSSWREVYASDELREMLSDLEANYLGATAPGSRYESILVWLRQHAHVSSFRVLDDDPGEFPSPLPSEVILCDPRRGLSDPHVLAALRSWLEE